MLYEARYQRWQFERKWMGMGLARNTGGGRDGVSHVDLWTSGVGMVRSAVGLQTHRRPLLCRKRFDQSSRRIRPYDLKMRIRFAGSSRFSIASLTRNAVASRRRLEISAGAPGYKVAQRPLDSYFASKLVHCGRPERSTALACGSIAQTTALAHLSTPLPSW